MVVSGDYKRRRDPTCPPFEPVPCEVFISEATFACGVRLPRGQRGDRHAAAFGRAVPRALPHRRRLCAGQGAADHPPAEGGGYEQTIYVHGALARLNELYERHGIDLGPIAPATDDKNSNFAGAVIVAPPSALQDRWSRRFPDPVSAFASGWMRVRARARQRAVELPLVISDHADWNELTSTIKEINPAQLWITHGREEALARWAELNGIAAPAAGAGRLRGGRGGVAR